MSSRSRPGPPPGEPDWSRPEPGDYQPPADPWGQPTDAWGQPTDGWAGQPTQPTRPGGYPEPGYPGPPYPGPGHPPPPPSSPPRRNLGLYAVVAVLVLLAAAGVGYALYVLTGDDSGPTAGPSAGLTGTGSPDPSASPPDNIGLSAAVARVDDCLVNDGTSDQTQMRIVRCDEDSQSVVYQVLTVIDQRVDGADNDARNASAQAICAATEGYTHHYFEVAEQSSFVLCMAQQE